MFLQVRQIQLELQTLLSTYTQELIDVSLKLGLKDGKLD
jgi:hypothetical protein